MSNLDARVRNSFDRQGIMQTLGARLAEVAAGEVHIALPFGAHLSQQHGYLHAGVVTSVVDSACGYAALTRTPEDHEVVTIELKVNFTRPAMGETFMAVGQVETAGRQVAVCTGRMLARSGSSEKLVALMQATMMYVPS